MAAASSSLALLLLPTTTAPYLPFNTFLTVGLRTLTLPLNGENGAHPACLPASLLFSLHSVYRLHNMSILSILYLSPLSSPAPYKFFAFTHWRMPMGGEERATWRWWGRLDLEEVFALTTCTHCGEEGRKEGGGGGLTIPSLSLLPLLCSAGSSEECVYNHPSI